MNNDIYITHKQYHNDNKKSFSSYIKEKRKQVLSTSGRGTLSTRELSKLLDINYEMFRKIINMNKPTKKRDCIIAICALLKLDSDETNEALVLYRYMPMLDSNNERDDLLIDILEEQLTNPLSIEEINQRLIRNGYPELDIIDHRISSSKESHSKDIPYKILQKEVNTFTNDIIGGDMYESLSTQYAIFRYKYFGKMIIGDPKEKMFRLTIDSRDNNKYRVETRAKNINESVIYDSIDATGVFKDYFWELEASAKKELSKILSTLDDTKNYHIRKSADVSDGCLRLFAETYNYRVPEFNEYIVVVYTKGSFRLYLYNVSKFMHYYLGEDEYNKVYGNYNLDCEIQFTEEELIDLVNERKNKNHERLLIYKAIFIQLKSELLTLLDNLRSRKEFMNNIDRIYGDEDVDRVCEYYEVSDEFDCRLVGEYNDMLVAYNKEHVFKTDTGEEIQITIADLYRAFELGFSSISDICQAKLKYGSIEKILES